MTAQQLVDALTRVDETVQVEAKAGRDVGASILETVSAMSNEPGLGGGYLLLGVRERKDALFTDWEIVGVDDPDKVQSDLVSQCAHVFNVAVRPSVAVEILQGRRVVVAFVPEADAADKPVFLKATGLPRGAFRRVGSSDVRCTEDDVRALYADHDGLSYDRTPVRGSGLNDVDDEALTAYRRLRGEVSPSAGELHFSDRELLHALGATASEEDASPLTIAGLVLFGKPAALRRLLPFAKVDYIIVAGREWVEDPDHRYQGLVEFRAPLLSVVPKIIAQIESDLPRTFALLDDGIRRSDHAVIPRAVLREAVVNALTHRTYRAGQPIQIIRFSNRVEFRNPGFSLVPEERLGTPGSLTRNVMIGAAMHDCGFADIKGTGIRAMRSKMRAANLTEPIFTSERSTDRFSATFVTHNLFGEDAINWLAGFRGLGLTDDQMRALVTTRELGYISNWVFRDQSGLDTLGASLQLRRLKELGLLEAQGKGSATYYVLTPDAVSPGPGGMRHKVLPSKSLGTVEESLSRPNADQLAALRAKVAGRVLLTKAQLEETLLELCDEYAMSARELSALTGRSTLYIQSRVVRPLVARGILSTLFPGPIHPRQAYLTPRLAQRLVDQTQAVNAETSDDGPAEGAP